MPQFGITLLSGGLDSTTVTAYAKDQVDHITAITFHYGQAHSKEVDCAGQIAGILGVDHGIDRHLISLEDRLVLRADQPGTLPCAVRAFR